MIRKVLLVLAVLALLGATGAVQAQVTPMAVAKPTKHTTVYTAKQRFKDTKTGQVVTGIRTATGGVFEGFDRVVETVDPGPTTMQPDSASAVEWQRVGYVEDQATWTGSTDGYNYTLSLKASVGWQQVDPPDGPPYYNDTGPFQYREQPACYRSLKSGGGQFGTSCNFSWNNSALEWKNCAPYEGCFIDAPWGFRDFYQPSAVAILFAGAWHTLDLNGYHNYGSLESFTGEARARFLAPNPSHLTLIYKACSFWYQPITDIGGRDNGCSGLVPY